MDKEPTYETVDSVAQRLGVPAKWLRTEAERGRVPSLRAGRRLLLSVEAVEQALRKRAAEGVGYVS